MSGVEMKTIDADDAGMRLDRWFKRENPHIAHGRVEKLLRTGQIRVDGKRAKGNFRLDAGMIIRVPPLPSPTEVKVARAEASSDDIGFMRSITLLETDDMFALNKPAGLAVQGGTNTPRHIDGLLPALGAGCRLVHRLDRDTSGVLLIAKNAQAARRIGKAFASRQAEKLYWGVTNGVPRPLSGEIKGFINKGVMDNTFGNDKIGREIMVAVRTAANGAKHARTFYQTISTAGSKAAWVAMQPLTGRTHQLRLHMQLLGAPIAGDPKYLTDRPLPGGVSKKLHLHARKIILPQETGSPIEVTAPLPPHMDKAFNMFGFDRTTPHDLWDDIV